MRLLAKLREFRKGMNIEGYLVNEMRQNLRSIDLFMQDQTLFETRDVLFANPDEEANNSTVTFSLDDAVIKSGVVNDNFYYPPSGKYFVDFHAQFINNRVNNVPLGTMNVFAVSSATNDLFSSKAISSYTIQNNVVINNPGRVAFFADLSPNIGIGFRGASLNLGLVIQNFNLKITKVG